MLTTLIRNIALFLYISLVVSFVWAALNQKGFSARGARQPSPPAIGRAGVGLGSTFGRRQIVREGLKTFCVFTICALVLAVIVHFLS